MGTNGASSPSYDSLDVGALARDRDYIKAALPSCSAPLASKVLTILDELREIRRVGLRRSDAVQSDDLRSGGEPSPMLAERRDGRRPRAIGLRLQGEPSPTLAELRDEIAWRVDTLPPDDTAIIVRLLRRVLPPDGQAPDSPRHPRLVPSSD